MSQGYLENLLEKWGSEEEVPELEFLEEPEENKFMLGSLLPTTQALGFVPLEYKMDEPGFEWDGESSNEDNPVGFTGSLGSRLFGSKPRYFAEQILQKKK